MVKHKRFTEEEDAIIKKYIKSSKTLKEAFEAAAEELNRTIPSVKMRYTQSKEFDTIKANRKNERTKRSNKIKKILIKELQNNPTNINEAFKKVSDKTGLTLGSISNGYYSSKSYLSKRNLGVCFSVISKDRVIYNGKNSDTKQPIVNMHKTNKFIQFFKNLFK